MEQSDSNKTNPILLLGVVAILLAIGAVVILAMRATPEPDLSNETSEETTLNNFPTDTPVEENESLVSDSLTNEDTIEVEGGSFYYNPNELRVKAGETVTIKFNSVDMMHDLVIDELNVRTPIVQAGNSSLVTFTPAEPGEYDFYCSVSNHRAQGMVGTLIVE